MKTFTTMFVGGAVTLVLLKLLFGLMLPLMGALLGFVFTVLKVAVLVAVAYFVYSLLFKRKKEQEVA